VDAPSLYISILDIDSSKPPPQPDTCAFESRSWARREGEKERRREGEKERRREGEKERRREGFYIIHFYLLYY